MLPMQSAIFATELTPYERSVTVLYSAYNAVKFMEGICARHYPEYKEQNSSAYEQWELKYLDYLNEINLHWMNLSFENAKDKNGKIDFEKSLSNSMKMGQIINQTNKTLEKEILKSSEKFIIVCKTFPSVFLNLKTSNIENYYKNETKIIRQKKEFIIE